jgi:cyclopropane-fatty-acyl-phospholipid synthase
MNETRELTVDFAPVQAHYDISDGFFECFLDPSMTYSCAYYPTGRETLEEAQTAKIDLCLRKLQLQPGERLLDIGCGWGALALRAHDAYRATVVGLTLSPNQAEHARRLAAGREGLEFRCEGWETYQQPADKIVSVGAFEHFTRAKHPAFFARCHRLLPRHGALLLHTITFGKASKSFAFWRFGHFLTHQIFPGGEVPTPEEVLAGSRSGDFELVHAESLRPHYATTIRHWLTNLEENRERAVAERDEATYTTFVKYLRGCADYFESGEINVYQFLLRPV